MKKGKNFVFIVAGMLVLFTSQYFIKPVYAQEVSAIFYWGTGCPYCDVAKDEIIEKGIAQEINIEYKEIYNDITNQNDFKAKLNACGLNQGLVPMLYMDDKCYVGSDTIINALEIKLGNFNNVPNINQQVREEVQGESVEKQSNDDTGKNTRIMIIGILFILIAIVGFGSFLQNKKAQAVNMIIVISTFMVTWFSFTNSVLAVCPVCTVAVGAGLGFSRYFGIDDVIMSIWIGGLVLSMSFTTGEWINKKTKLKKTGSTVVAVMIFYTLLFVTLNALHITGDIFNTLWGIDKIVLGTIVGSVMFFIGAKLHFYLKEKHENNVFIPFQKVIIPVGALWVATTVFYFIIY